MHLEVKVKQNVKNKVLRYKQTTSKVPLMFLDVKMLKERYDRSLRRFKQKSKVRRMYLAFKKFKISGKWSSEWLKTKKQSTCE